MKKEIKQVITIILIAIAICFSDNLFAQSFIGVQGTNKGFNLQIGYVVPESNIVLQTGYKVPLINTDVASVFNFSAGKQFSLTNNEEDNYTLSALVGIGNYHIKDFTEYDKGGQIITINKLLPVYTLEVGKDIYKGRIFISANYCNSFYFGAGIKAFIR